MFNNIFNKVHYLFLINYIFLIILSFIFCWDVNKIDVFSFTFIFTAIFSALCMDTPRSQENFKSRIHFFFLILKYFLLILNQDCIFFLH